MRCTVHFLGRSLLMGMALALLVGCASHPRPYKKKKRGCDCPQWNKVDRAPEGVHASTATIKREG